MTFAVSTNIATMILCIAVLIQTVRLMRALDTVKSGALTDVVTALDNSTGEARRVLGRLTELLRGDVAVTARTFGEGRAMIEELAVMTGIANAIAERIVDAAGASNQSARALVDAKLPAPPQKPKRLNGSAPKAARLAPAGEPGLPSPTMGPAARVRAPRRQKPATSAKASA
jgi:hypothetical protein